MANPIQYNVSGKLKAVNGYGQKFGNNTFTCTLAANTNTTLAVPLTSGMGAINSTDKSFWLAIFTYDPDSKVYAANNTAATAPSSGAFASTKSVLNPQAKIVMAGDTLNFLCVAGCNMTVEFYYISEP